MTIHVTVNPGARQFVAAADETLLEAALRQGLDLPHGCRNGTCGLCKIKVLEGRIDPGRPSPRALLPDEEERGYALMCCARTSVDLVVETCSEPRHASTPGRVASIDRLAPDVVRVCLQMPSGTAVPYRAGQFLQIILRDGTRRCYSMASAPGHGPIELHVRNMPGGVVSDMLFGAAEKPIKVRDILRLSLPHGNFYLREDSDKPIVFLASGTGFAPIKAIIEQELSRHSNRTMMLYWGGRRPSDLYMDSLARSWERDRSGFTYVPVLSEARTEDAWDGRRGLVHRAVMADHGDLSSCQVYACGAPGMVEAAQRDFVAERRLPEDEFYADVFTSRADIPVEAA